MKKSLSVLIALVLLLLLLLAYAKAPAAAAPTTEKVVHFYCLDAFTGQSAAYGLRAAHGQHIAAQKINKAGGFKDNAGNTYTIKLTDFDMANSREEAITGLRTAAGDPTAMCILGPSPSTGYVPMVPAAAEMKIPVISTGSAAVIKNWNIYAFRVSLVTDVVSRISAQLMKKKFDIKRLAVIYDITQDGQRSYAEGYRNLAKELGYEVVAFEASRAGDVDFRSQITKIKATNPDWVNICLTTEEGSNFINQSDELGLLKQINNRVWTWGGNLSDTKWWDRTNGKILGMYNWALGVSVSSSDPNMRKFVADYKAAYVPEDPTEYSLLGVQSLMLAVDAVKKSSTNTDREKFTKALGTAAVDDWYGSAKFQNPPNGENLKPAITIYRCTGRGKMEPIQ